MLYILCIYVKDCCLAAKYIKMDSIYICVSMYGGYWCVIYGGDNAI